MSIYADFATLPTEIEDFSVGGPAFTGVRGTSTGLAAPSYAALSSRRLVFIAQALEGFVRTFPEVEVWKAPWLVFALLAVDVQSGDIYTDGTLAYTITATPVTHYMFVLAPASPLPLAEVPTVGATGQAGYRSPLWILGVSA